MFLINFGCFLVQKVWIQSSRLGHYSGWDIIQDWDIIQIISVNRVILQITWRYLSSPEFESLGSPTLYSVILCYLLGKRLLFLRKLIVSSLSKSNVQLNHRSRQRLQMTLFRSICRTSTWVNPIGVQDGAL